MSELLAPIFSNVWSTILVVLFFGGSIFVHELGHFLAARKRGVKVTRFSIGFGPKIVSWKGKDGVEYCLSWLPIGGYVALPQLADMRGLEGEADPNAERLPPIDYTSKMIVFAAGAAFNIAFAFALASIVWVIGWPEPNDGATSRIGYVAPTVERWDKKEVPSPASLAGLKPGDLIVAIDGSPVHNWNGVMQTLITSTGRSAEGNPRAVFRILRDGTERDIVVEPQLASDDRIRRVGIAPDYELLVHKSSEGSVGTTLGFKVGDEIRDLDGQPVRNAAAFVDYLAANKDRPITAHVKRGEESAAITIPPRPNDPAGSDLGLRFSPGFVMTHPTPFAQIADNVRMSFQTLRSLVSPTSDVGLSKLSGPVGIVRVFYDAASAGIRYVLWFTILINVSLAIFNLMPIPVLDGGHMVFATIARISGRALPIRFIMTTQSVFMVLLLSMIVYVTFFDSRRWLRDIRLDREAASQAPPAK